MRRTVLSGICSIASAVAFAPGATAADYYDALYPPAVAYLPPPAYVPAPYYAQPHYYLPPVAVYDPRPRVWYSHPPPAYYQAPVVALEPLRPRSCGKYRYWNGDYCADARYQRPYVGPRW